MNCPRENAGKGRLAVRAALWHKADAK